jgi:hypothetical protein
MNTGRTNRSNYYSYEKWGPQDGKIMVSDLSNIGWWKKNGGWGGSNACNVLNASDGQQFHPEVKKDEKLYVFVPDLCGRSMIEFEEGHH